MAGAVLGASRKGCGAPGRGPRLLSAWQAQHLEPPERVAARRVAVGHGSCLRVGVGGWGPRYLACKRERGSARIPRLLGEDRFQSVDPFDLEP